MWHRIQFPIVNAIFGISRRYEIRTAQVMLPATLIGPRVGPKMRVTVDACTSAAPICAGKHHGIGGWSFYPITETEMNSIRILQGAEQQQRLWNSPPPYHVSYFNNSTFSGQLFLNNHILHNVRYALCELCRYLQFFLVCVRWVFCMANMWVD